MHEVAEGREPAAGGCLPKPTGEGPGPKKRPLASKGRTGSGSALISISQKVQIVVEHFRENVSPLLGGKAKAMVAAPVSRLVGDPRAKVRVLVQFWQATALWFRQAGRSIPSTNGRSASPATLTGMSLPRRAQKAFGILTSVMGLSPGSPLKR
jgi:hypothetical protein